MALIGGSAAYFEYHLGKEALAFGAIADAWHLASDTSSDVVALGVVVLAANYASSSKKIITSGAYIQALLLATASVLIFWEMTQKTNQPNTIDAIITIKAGLVGLVGNGCRFYILNIKKGEWNVTRLIQNKHVRADLMYSFGVVLEGTLVQLMSYFGLNWSFLDWVILSAIFIYVAKLSIEAFQEAKKNSIHFH